MKRIAIMQPYFFPYIGYFQLIHAVDEFILYDNIEFSKKGWINRNRILINGKAAYITLPLKKTSDFLDIRERYLAESWDKERIKMLNRIFGVYKKSSNFEKVFPLIEVILMNEKRNLFGFIQNSIEKVTELLGIETPKIVSSNLPINHNLRSEEKVIEICKVRGASKYLNPIGGLNLYNASFFKREDINLQFIKTEDIQYRQFDNRFVPSLSIIDVMMFNTEEKIRAICSSGFNLIDAG